MKRVLLYLGLFALFAFWISGVNFKEIRLGPAMLLQALFLCGIGIELLRGKISNVPICSWLLLPTGGYFLWKTLGEGPSALAAADQLLIQLSVFGILAVGALRAFGGRFVDRHLLIGIGLLIVANLGVALWQWKGDSTFQVFEGLAPEDTQASGLLTHHNPFAAMMAGFAGYAMASVLLVRSVKWRVMAGLGVLACVGCVALSQSRGGSLSLGMTLAAVTIFAFLIRHFQKNSDAGRIAFMGIVGLVLMLLAFGGYMTFLQEARGKDFFGEGVRSGLYQLAVNLFLEQPIDGHGPRAFSYLSAQRWSFSDHGWTSAMLEFAHNEYLQLLVDYGAVGMMCVVVVLGCVLIAGFVRVFSGEDTRFEEEDVLLAGAFAGLAGMSVQIFFSFLLHVPSTLMLCVFHLGVLLSWNTSRRKKLIAIVSDRLMGGIFLIGAVLFGFLGFRYSSALWKLEQAEREGGAEKMVKAFYHAGAASGQSSHFTKGAALALAQYEHSSDPDRREKWVKLAQQGYENSHLLNPQAPEGASGIAVSLDFAGQHEEARPWHELALKNSGGIAWRLGFQQMMGLSLFRGAFQKMAVDELAAEEDLRLAAKMLRHSSYLGETPEQVTARRTQRVFLLKWLSYLEGRRLFIAGEKAWKKRQAPRGMALMLAAQKKYRTSQKEMANFDSRWQVEWDQLGKNLNLLKVAKIRPVQLSKEEIDQIALGPFKDGLATGGGRR